MSEELEVRSHTNSDLARYIPRAGATPDPRVPRLSLPLRRRGLGVRFFDEREAHARRLGGFRWTAFCAVDRPLDHPRRPPDQVPLARFWEKRGYHREPDLKAVFSWRDLDDNAATGKPMTFWMRRLETPGSTRNRSPSCTSSSSSSRLLDDAHCHDPLLLTSHKPQPPILDNGNNP